MRAQLQRLSLISLFLLFNFFILGQHDEIAWGMVPRSDLKNKWLTRISDLPSFTIEASKTKPEAKVSYVLQIPRYAARAGKRLFVPLNAFNKWEYVPRASKDRTQNVFVETSY